jgi:predicted nucleotidyltransferase component of viral defense system
MIEREEIELTAAELEVHTSDVQRDYVFGWLLYGMFTASRLKDTLFLKGGNALRKAYFARTRFSRDLDFGIPNNIDAQSLREDINQVCEVIQPGSGITFVPDNTRVDEKFTATDAPLPDLKVYEARVYFKNFYGETGSLKLRISMDITRFDRVLLPLQSRPLIHPYSDAAAIACDIRVMQLEEIIATKLKCLMQRQHAPDLFDYAHSISLVGGTLDKAEVTRTLLRKTIFQRNPYVLKQILLKTAFDYFREVWDKSLVCAKQVLMTAEAAINAFTGDLEVLFDAYPDTGYKSFAFFSADLRAPIMQAARNQTLLKICYKGEGRVVEPYSLKYQERRDGVQREYFFAYKVSGGHSPPGIRCFVAEHMESIENTDTKFEPRHQIELSKAGEMPDDPYLFDPNRPARAPRMSSRTGRRSTRVRGSMKYSFRCSSCGKRFTRSTHDSTLRPHKNKAGYSCYGSYGIYLGAKYR